MSSSTSSRRVHEGGLGPVAQLGALPGDPLAVVVELGREAEMLLAGTVELLLETADGLLAPLHGHARRTAAAKDWLGVVGA